MTHDKHAECELHMVLPATLQAIEEFLAEFRRRTRTFLERVDCFGAELLVREALTNAVIHGADTDPGKQVRCSMRFKEKRLLIAIRDDGDGFDWRGASRRAAGFTDCSGRGIRILRHYANRVRYNDKGNVVTIVKRFH